VGDVLCGVGSLSSRAGGRYSGREAGKRRRPQRRVVGKRLLPLQPPLERVLNARDWIADRATPLSVDTRGRTRLDAFAPRIRRFSRVDESSSPAVKGVVHRYRSSI
jgi:hypothetical protein